MYELQEHFKQIFDVFALPFGKNANDINITNFFVKIIFLAKYFY